MRRLNAHTGDNPRNVSRTFSALLYAGRLVFPHTYETHAFREWVYNGAPLFTV